MLTSEKHYLKRFEQVGFFQVGPSQINTTAAGLTLETAYFKVAGSR